MVRYCGGKHRIGKEIATVIQSIEREMGYSCLPYFEAFLGAAGVMQWMGQDLLSSSSNHSRSRSKSYSGSRSRSVERSGSKSYSRSRSNRRSRSESPRSRSDGSSRKSRSTSRDGKCRRLRFGSDANDDMISMWKALQKNWRIPTHCDQKLWDKTKASRGPTPERAFFLAFCSFGGHFGAGKQKIVFCYSFKTK